MVSKHQKMLGIALAVIGWIGVILVCALPKWKVWTEGPGAAFMGLWGYCMLEKGQWKCGVYSNQQFGFLPDEYGAARALTVISILVGLVGLLLAGAGGKCTKYVEGERAKSKVAIMPGIIFIIAGLLCLFAVCSVASTINSNSLKEQLGLGALFSPKVPLGPGASFFIGLAASALLIIGGAVFSANCSKCKEGILHVFGRCSAA